MLYSSVAREVKKKIWIFFSALFDLLALALHST